MRLMDKILEKEPEVYKNKRPFFKLENKDVEKIAESLFKSITGKIVIDKKTGYRNEKIKNALFTHPSIGCKENDDKNTISATKRKNKNGTFYLYSEPEPNMERMIKLAWNKYKKDGVCENQFPIPDTNENKGINIDILIKREHSIEFIELKQWSNGDNPAFAIAEVIKNLYVFIHFYKHLFVFDYEFREDFDIKEYKKLYNLDKVNKFILTVLAPTEYYSGYFKNKEIKNKELLKENYKQFYDYLKNLVQEDLREKLNKNDLEIEIRIKSFEFSREKQYDVIKDKLIKDKIEKNKKEKGTELIKVSEKKTGEIKYTTGDIDLKGYFEKEDYFSKKVCEQLVNWTDFE